ncbi:MAG: M48 family metallopeptidase [Alistipes sp.]|nr:M48 family metallopeptidase [Alistipes sp.]
MGGGPRRLKGALSAAFGSSGRPTPGTPKKRTAPPKNRKSTVSTIEHPELGRVQLALSRKARRITLTVRPDCTIRLSVPYGIPVATGLQFLETKKQWASVALMKYRSLTRTIMPPYSTREHRLVVVPAAAGKPPGFKVGGGLITVTCPEGMPPDGPQVQQAVKKGICEAMRQEAKAMLPVRLEELSRATGLQYGKVTVRNTVSKWGSCSARNDISLSLHLMRLPDHLIDYVLIHELCHTVHKNHGPQFHDLLDRLTGGRHMQLRRELKGYHTRW